MALFVDVVEDDARFAALGGEWEALLRASAARCLFLTWEWLHTWWRHLGARHHLSLFAVREGGTLLGIAPFARRRRWAGFPGLDTVEFLGSGDVGSDDLDLICRPEDEGRVLHAVAGHLATRRALLRLRRLQPSSLAARLAGRLSGAGWSLTRSAQEVCPWIPLEGHTWDSYLASLGAEHRANVRRRIRNLERAGAHFERVDSEERRRAVFPALVALHNARWSGRGRSEAFHHAGLVAFHDEVSRLALARGWLRLFALHLEGRVVAALYGFVYEGRFNFYQSGFDPAVGRLSPGLAVMGLAIRSAIDERASAFDMLHGDEAYKFLWCRQVRELARVELFPPTAAGTVARRAADTLRVVKTALRRAKDPGAAPAR